MRRLWLGLILAALAFPAAASETITYTYDTNGRLITVQHTGSVNNGVTTQYTHDKADNRTQVTTSGGSTKWGAFTWGSANWNH